MILALLEKRDQKEAIAHFERAVSLVADRPPTREKGVVLARYGSQLLLSNEPARARETTQAALKIAEALGDDDMRAQALLSLGQSRLNLGDPDGLEDMERARELALESNSLETAERVWGNLADSYASHRANLARCFELQAEGRRVVDRIGTTAFRYFFAGERVTELYVRGDWDEASALGGKVADELSHHPNPHFIQVPTRAVLARIASGRGDEERAESESAIALELGRAIGDLQVLYSALESRAVVLLDSGRPEEARAVVDETSRTRRASSSVRATHICRGKHAWAWSGCACITGTARSSESCSTPRHAGRSIPPGGT